jgi:hypothetical protein
MASPNVTSKLAEAPNAPRKIKIRRSNEELDSIRDLAKKAYNAIQSQPEPKYLKRTDKEIIKNRLQAEKDAMDAFKSL